MKKLLIVMSILILTACGKSNNVNIEDIDITDVSNISLIEEEQKLKPGEVWRVPGQWQLTIDSLEVAKEDTISSKKGDLVLKYTYQNLGYDHIYNLTLAPMIDYGNGELIGVETSSYDGYKMIPIGAIHTAETRILPNGNSDKFKIRFSHKGDSSVDKKDFEAIYDYPLTK